MVKCQDSSSSNNNNNDFGQFDNPSILPLLTQLVNEQISNLTTAFLTNDVKERANFCVQDPDADWNEAFNFSSNLNFVSSCIKQTRGDITQRVCTAAEMKLYLNSFFESGGANMNMKPNRNCNLTSWVSGCEPGWACSVGQDQQVDLQNSREIPSRNKSCQSCCAGFFCPQGLTCMIPCPLGSYCPLATLNETTGKCDPYDYRLPSGNTTHTCGGANIWSDVARSPELFCSAGSYCPTTTENNSCSSGITYLAGCFRLSSCNANTANQNIHAYGLLLIAAMGTLLVIIYNCSGQALTTRERRLAKSREEAARSARETSRARHRWKNAKDAAKKGASGLQAQLSRTFSRKKSIHHSEELKILSQPGTNGDDLYTPPHPSLYTPSHPSSSNSPISSFEPSNRKKNERKQIVHEIEDDPVEYEDLDLESRGSKPKGNFPKAKDFSTNSQIFRYAYSQLEKEKAQQKENKDLTFSGVVSMATNFETKKRPLIEISFKDLSLTLKAKNKHLLRCLTGKIKPGRITAVMGPSGAGKTTLLNALAGKPIGCLMTGSILINGKPESILSYKKIVGFVPQDDIVHGNLTVEENIWFSAHCRLSSDLAKADKVLVVERVIESLGLQTVRDSLVGTVEKRGISGGQRKRVNVGLEMVMEPSLLFLDEPTSGLDSASSQLLLRALRRESLEGVNISMVVHQPSYSLFRMFDDLILLAKGGLTVYHGSVKKVEEYFIGLGIKVPERVNPPDHYIDILEGIVTPNPRSTVSYSELPIRWMLHNGYKVPPDMRETATGLLGQGDQVISLGDGITDASFVGELWQDVVGNVDLHRDKIRHNFSKTKDLSNRGTPGVLMQYKYYLGRVTKQRLREAKLQAVDYLILLLAGACLGSLSSGSDQSFGANGYTYTIIAVSLLCMIAALRSFSLDKLQYWRESASGMSSLSYFLAKDTVDHFNTLIKPLVYLSMFYFFTNPRSTFTDNYIVLLCLVYCVTGIAYALAIFFQPGSAQLWSVLLPVVFTLVATQPRNNEALKIIVNFCYPRWALEAFVIANAQRYYGVWLITRCGSLLKNGYDLHHWGLCIAILPYPYATVDPLNGAH
ncbi:hypothetical protein ACFE04_009006 [Oxalis oulophora]